MTSRPPIALVKRGPELYITGVLPRDGKPPGHDLIAVLFIGQGLPHQAYLAGLGYGPVGEGDTHELAAQALVEKLQAETLDFPAFLLALAKTAEDIAEGQHANEDEEIALEQQAALLHMLAGLAAQEHRDVQIANMLRPRMEETGEAFVAETIRGMLTEIENSRREAAAHRGARAVEAVGAEGELQALRSELALVRAEAGSLRQQRDAFRQERAQARELAHSPDEWAPLEMRVATWRIWLASKGISGTGPLTDEGFRQAFDALEDESRRLTNDRHDELQREIGAQAEDLETLRDEVATERKLARAAAEGHDHVRGILLEIAAVFGRVDDLDTLPARQREAVARDNHVRGLLLEIAAVFGSIDDLDTLPARVREAAARGSS